MAIREQVQRLGKGTLIYGVGGFLGRFASLLFLPLFTAYLTPTDYGISGLLGMLSMIVVPVFSLGLGASLGICYFQEPSAEKKAATIGTAFAILAVSTSILALLGVLYSGAISQVALGTSQFPHLVTLALLTAGLSIVVQPFMLYLQFEERAKTFVAISLLTTLVSLAASIWMVVFLRRGVEGLLWAGLLAQAVNLLIGMGVGLRPSRVRLNAAIGRELLRLGLPMVPSFASLFLISQANRYILQGFDGLAPVGIYSIGLNLGMVLNIGVSGFQSAWLPYFLSFSDKREEARILFGRITTYFLFGFGGAGVLFFIVAKPLVMLMVAPAFQAAYQVVGLAATAQLLAGVFSLLLPAVYYAKDVSKVVIVQGLAAVLAIAISIPLIAAFGLFGAAISLPLGYLLMVALQHAWNCHRRSTYFQVAYEWGRIGQFSLVYMGVGVLTLVPRNLSMPMEVGLSLALGALLLVFYDRMLAKEEKQAIWTLLQPWLPASWRALGLKANK